MRAANFQGKKSKLRASLARFGHITCMGDQGTRKDRASLVQAMAAARKPDQMGCDLWPHGCGCCGKLQACTKLGRGIKVLAWKNKLMA